MTTSSGLVNAARRSYNALKASIGSTSGSAQESLRLPARIPFRPQAAKLESTQKLALSVQDPVSISGLRFCLHMVLFAAPGVILSKKLCDGERLEDIVQNTRERIDSLVRSYV
ncbi:hypothetical protein BGZ70_007131 [Mortierella alpina]|uniref:Uncharacterized protein n=1 Tax=Mortierella alpina TaxID=64518 RepID=A0A9P6M6W5_MORAP|nr:hypothetical protein BGZ70_007131 [Mortierella alpina]